jgi:hypothetical protein
MVSEIGVDNSEADYIFVLLKEQFTELKAEWEIVKNILLQKIE